MKNSERGWESDTLQDPMHDDFDTDVTKNPLLMIPATDHDQPSSLGFFISSNAAKFDMNVSGAHTGDFSHWSDIVITAKTSASVQAPSSS